MNDLTLESLVVENFRSINGRIVVPMRAPVILVHGPNGAGKSSFMTALALALGGAAIPDVADPKHLVHHDAKRALISLGTSAGRKEIEITPNDRQIVGGALDPATATFFAERCYLEQTKLTRLLDLYQRKDKSDPESALTRFVKELLRIDELDSLIGGLDPVSTNVLRVERDLPVLRTWRADVRNFDDEMREMRNRREQLAAELDGLVRAADEHLFALGYADDSGSQEERVASALSLARNDEDALVDAEIRSRRGDELLRRSRQLGDNRRVSRVVEAEAVLTSARERRATWWQQDGKSLDTVFAQLRNDFTRLPSIETASPGELFDQARDGVANEIHRLRELLSADTANRSALEDTTAAISAGRRRLEALDAELGDETALSGLSDLARALAGLAPHISGNECPVCGRDFSEVSTEPLSTHLATEISRLGARANELQALARARLETTTDLRRMAERETHLRAEQLAPERRDAEAARLRRFEDLRATLDAHERGAREGGLVTRNLIRAEEGFAQAQREDREHVSWREDLEQLIVESELEIDPAPDAERLKQFQALLTDRRNQLEARNAHRRALNEQRAKRLDLNAQLADATEKIARAEARHKRQAEAVELVERRIASARNMLRHANQVRRTTIAAVFNSALNEAWGELFVRLAPDEPYVPAFSPPSVAGPVTTKLETRRRNGPTAGEPRDMLSAGNLNTAALTLFLALHLSVARRVPWLLLDDPVQSMDEIHTAQFAALLRTLTQQLNRNIVIAVHERALFEYLSLELSPANSEGRLVTVELRRERNGASTARVVTREFEADTAIAAAS